MGTIITLNELDRVEILSLQDNFIDITAMDNSAVISRAKYLKDGMIATSIQAEHGFSAIVKTTVETRKRKTHALLFDFGFSAGGAAYNAAALGVDMGEIEVLALSHGHSDHTGGFEALVKMIRAAGRKDLDLVLHPGAFRKSRYLKFGESFKARFPEFTRERIENAGVRVVEAKEPCRLLDGDILFLGEIERRTDFEKGMPNAYFGEGDAEKKDAIEEDTSLVMNLRGKGLIILSGCAHSGIVNTVQCARWVTGIAKIHAIMGGFHLAGPAFEPVVEKTLAALKDINPDTIVPCHCTGRKAVMAMEREMPGQFILNMAGTKLSFAA